MKSAKYYVNRTIGDCFAVAVTFREYCCTYNSIITLNLIILAQTKGISAAPHRTVGAGTSKQAICVPARITIHMAAKKQFLCLLKASYSCTGAYTAFENALSCFARMAILWFIIMLNILDAYCFLTFNFHAASVGA